MGGLGPALGQLSSESDVEGILQRQVTPTYIGRQVTDGIVGHDNIFSDDPTLGQSQSVIGLQRQVTPSVEADESLNLGPPSTQQQPLSSDVGLLRQVTTAFEGTPGSVDGSGNVDADFTWNSILKENANDEEDDK